MMSQAGLNTEYVNTEYVKATVSGTAEIIFLPRSRYTRCRQRGCRVAPPRILNGMSPLQEKLLSLTSPSMVILWVSTTLISTA